MSMSSRASGTLNASPGILLALCLFSLYACTDREPAGNPGQGRGAEEAGGQASLAGAEGPSLRFGSDGTFTIVHFTDSQDDQEIDPRTVGLMEAVLDDHQPDLVVFTGDNVRSGPETGDDVRAAMDAIAHPVDSRGIPWLITFGNHDEDHMPRTGVGEGAMLDYYMSLSLIHI